MASSDMDMDMKPCQGTCSIKQALIPIKDSSFQFPEMKEECEHIHAGYTHLGKTGSFVEKNLLQKMAGNSSEESSPLSLPQIVLHDPNVIKCIAELHEIPEYKQFVHDTAIMFEKIIYEFRVLDEKSFTSNLERAIQNPQVVTVSDRLESALMQLSKHMEENKCIDDDFLRIFNDCIVETKCPTEKAVLMGLAELLGLKLKNTSNGILYSGLDEIEGRGDEDEMEFSLLGTVGALSSKNKNTCDDSNKEKLGDGSKLCFVHRVVAYGDPEGLEVVLERGYGRKHFIWEGRTPLFTACRYGKVECAKLLIQEGVRVNARDDCNNSALHFAAYYGHKECVALLLKHGAEVIYKNQRGFTPVDIAKLTGHSDDLVKLLEEHNPVPLVYRLFHLHA